MNTAHAVVVGLGQIGSELAEGLRAAGCTVIEVHRDGLASLAAHEACDLAVLAAPEDVLGDVASHLPDALRSRAVLVQNELVPATWRALGLERPTVAVVWFERKGGRSPRPILPTRVGGPHADVLVDALLRRGVPAERIGDGGELVRALVAKNLYIVGSNLAGLGAARNGRVVGAEVSWPTGAKTMGELLGSHLVFARALAREVFAVELARLDAAEREGVDFDEAWEVVVAATAADPAHACLGRSAPARLERALHRAREASLVLPIVRALGATT